MYTLQVRTNFEAAHILSGDIFSEKCKRLHGHSYKVDWYFSGDTKDANGMLVDFGLLKRMCKEITDNWDHRYIINLNDTTQIDVIVSINTNFLDNYTDNCVTLDGNPTAETMAFNLFYKGLAAIKKEGLLGKIDIVKVSVWETENNCASYFIEE